jgi:hypothetical protein
LWVLSLYLYTNIRYNRYSRYIVPINTKEGKMENLRNFGDGSQGAGNDTADIGEHTDEGLGAMKPKAGYLRTYRALKNRRNNRVEG